MSKPVSGIDYLLSPASHAVGSVCAVAGDEAYLKREVLREVRRGVCGGASDGDDGDFSWQAFVGKEAEWRDVSDALASLSLFGSGGQRAAVVEDADTFVTRYRPQLEDYVDKPPAGAVLVLDVKTWPGNTRLAKAVAKSGLTLKCGVPDRGAEVGAFRRSLTKWLAHRARENDAKLPDASVAVLLDLLPTSVGLLDQEVAKLALLVGAGGTISPDVVKQNVGGWRAQKTWDMIDAMADGDAASALEQLDRLLRAGEQPIGLFAQISSTLRRYATACRLVEMTEARGQRPQLRQVLERAGAPKFKLADAERQLKRIGRPRARQLNDWLIETDLALKGHNSPPPKARIELERLVVRLSGAAR